MNREYGISTKEVKKNFDEYYYDYIDEFEEFMEEEQAKPKIGYTKKKTALK